MAKKKRVGKKRASGGTKKKGAEGAQARSSGKGKPRLLSGGNPQVAKADGEAPVRAYIAAMPGWKREVGERIDAIVARTVPGVQRAVRWNSPFWGVEGRGWFLSMHCITRYVKVTFFRGTSLEPQPPVGSKVPEVRYFHIHEDEEWDEKMFASWVKQASRMEGERCF